MTGYLALFGVVIFLILIVSCSYVLRDHMRKKLARHRRLHHPHQGSTEGYVSDGSSSQDLGSRSYTSASHHSGKHHDSHHGGHASGDFGGGYHGGHASGDFGGGHSGGGHH